MVFCLPSASGVHFAHCFVLLDSVNAAVNGIDCEWTGPTLRLTIQHICRRGGPKMRLQYCLIPSLEPNHPRRFLHFREIQGHSGGTLVDPTLQDKCTVSKGLRRAHLPHRERDRYALYHQQWTDSMSKKRERQCVFFTAVKPMDENRFPENVRYDLDKARTVAEKNKWQVHQKCSVLVQPETLSQERIAVPSKPIAHIKGPPSGYLAPS